MKTNFKEFVSIKESVNNIPTPKELKNLQDEYEKEYFTLEDIEKSFTPHMLLLQDSNNKEEIQKFIDYCQEKGVYLYSNAFLHTKLYKLNEKPVKAKDVDIDYNEIDKLFEIWHKQRSILDNVEYRISSMLDIILEIDDITELRKYIDSMSGVSYDNNRFFKKITKLMGI